MTQMREELLERLWRRRDAVGELVRADLALQIENAALKQALRRLFQEIAPLIEGVEPDDGPRCGVDERG